jgi:hypothetical protein
VCGNSPNLFIIIDGKNGIGLLSVMRTRSARLICLTAELDFTYTLSLYDKSRVWLCYSILLGHNAVTGVVRSLSIGLNSHDHDYIWTRPFRTSAAVLMTGESVRPI